MRRRGLVTGGLLLCASTALLAQAPAPPAVDSGDTAFMLVSAALVMLMTPGSGALLRRHGPRGRTCSAR